MKSRYLTILLCIFFASAAMAQTEEDWGEEDIEASDELLSESTPKVLFHKYKIGDGFRLSTQGGNKFMVSGMVPVSYTHLTLPTILLV